MQRTKNDFLTFGRPQIGEEEINEVEQTLRSGWLGTGPRVAQFEQEFAAYKGVSATQAIAVNSCTAALHLSLLQANLQPGDEVITTPLTFCATVNAIIHAGLTPVLADVDPNTLNISPAAIEAAITPRTRALLIVHFAGRACDMTAIAEIANKHNLVLIEDCAHAVETLYQGQQAGTFGDFGCFSFYATKNLVTGEGGMVVTKDAAASERIRRLALHGMSNDAWHRFGDDGYKHYLVEECGFKYNMMDIQAAIGIHQLRRLEANWLRRQAIWNTYQAAFKELPVTCPSELEPQTRHAYHLYTLQIDEQQGVSRRDAILEAMNRRHIGTGVHYLSIPEHPFYQQQFQWKPEHYPNAMQIGRNTLSLPLSANLTDRDVEDVIVAFSSALQEIL